MKKYALIVVLVLGCQTYRSLHIGDKIPNDATMGDSTTIQYSVNGHAIAQSITFEKIKYNIILDSAKKIKFLNTFDRNFASEEGLKIGDKYRDIKNKVIDKQFFPGYGFELRLKSGWFAAVGNRKIIEAQKMTDSAGIFVFYQPSIADQ